MDHSMRQRLLVAAIATALSGTAWAQAAPPAEGDPASVPVTYVGADTRVSLGVDDDLDLLGEVLHVFGHDGDSAWLGEAWLGAGGAGGVKLDYHWLLGATAQDAIERPDGVTVAKVFGAIDQNPWDDRKATLGFGLERERYFVDVYGAAALTDERLTDTLVDVDVSTVTGTQNGRPFRQTRTVTTTTRVFEQAYDWGLGARAGRFFDGQLARLRAGLDYEDGDYSSNQVTLSLGFDKLIPRSGHSLTLELEHHERDGDFVRDDSETEAWLLWRYDLGQSYRPVEPYRMVEVTREVPVEKPAAPVVVRNEVAMDNASFFALDSALLDADAQQALAALVETIRSDRRVSRVVVIGHTCDLGPTAYNQKLSERRAAAVREFLVAQGVAADEIDVYGRGELEPKYPNDGEANRRKNRRVDLSFLTIEESVETPAPVAATEPKVEWVREPVKAPAAWIERALRNPAEHKRTVDVYRFEKTSSATELGPVEFINRAPLAQNDSATVARDSSDNAINVLANDSDPDGDALSISAVGTPAHGSASIAGNAIRYTPTAGYVGSDSFSYTISDGQGGSAQATVTITVVDAPPIANPDSASTGPGRPVTLNVLANDSDPEGGPLSVVALGTPANGSATFSADGSVTYTPNAGFVGTDTFSYTVRDQAGNQAQGQVTISVTNSAPIAVDDYVETNHGQYAFVAPLANDSDPDGDALTIVSATNPGYGTIRINAGQTILYFPNDPRWWGVDTFTYTIRDAGGATATATIRVRVIDD
jgi:outer membrane protein OmpA-like peptidoglycan-associated protein